MVGEQQSEGNSPSHWLFTRPLMERPGLMGHAVSRYLHHYGVFRRLSLLFPWNRTLILSTLIKEGGFRDKPQHLTCSLSLTSNCFIVSQPFNFRPHSCDLIPKHLLCFAYISTPPPAFFPLCHSVFHFCHWLDELCLEKPQPVSSWKDC